MLTNPLPCPHCGQTPPSTTNACVYCGEPLVDPLTSSRQRPLQAGKVRISRRAALLGLAGTAAALTLGSGGWLWYERTRRPPLLAQTAYTGHQGAAITALTWSPDGSAIASGDVNGVTRIWDPATGATLLTCRPAAANSVASLSWAPDGSSILAGYTNMLVIWDVRSGKPTYTTTHLTGPAAYSPQGSYKPCFLVYPLLLAACQNQQSVVVFPSSSPSAPLASLNSGSISALVFDPVIAHLGLALVTAAPPRTITMYGATIPSTCGQSGQPNATLSYESENVSVLPASDSGRLSVPWGPGGGYLLGGNLPGKVTISGTWGTYEMDHPAEVVAAALCPARQPLPADARPDGWYTVIGYIATADSIGTIRIWGNDHKHLTLTQADQPVLQLAWSPDGHALASVTADGVAQAWQVNLSSLPALWRNTSFN